MIARNMQRVIGSAITPAIGTGIGVRHFGSHYFLVGTTLSTTATIHQVVLA
jgi:hypothetical protein